MKPQYIIYVSDTERSKWGFRYCGELSLWTRIVIRLAGWKAIPIKP